MEIPFQNKFIEIIRPADNALTGRLDDRKVHLLKKACIRCWSNIVDKALGGDTDALEMWAMIIQVDTQTLSEDLNFGQEFILRHQTDLINSIDDIFINLTDHGDRKAREWLTIITDNYLEY